MGGVDEMTEAAELNALSGGSHQLFVKNDWSDTQSTHNNNA